jgi:hypothetical protein
MNNRHTSDGPERTVRTTMANCRYLTVGTLLFGLILFICGGCASKTYLMPTPNVYTHPGWNPFADVPQELQTLVHHLFCKSTGVSARGTSAASSPRTHTGRAA